ncbi:MAG: nucleotidyltransferase domain-containing protein [Patescibacteria group bacterium]
MTLITEIQNRKDYSTSPDMLLLGEKEILSLIYHDIFDYPLTPLELIKWTAGESFKLKNIKDVKIGTQNGFLFINGKEGATLKRIMRKRVSERKIAQARKAAKILSILPTIRMIGISGSLAMNNASEESDIDFLIITKKDTLWTTRLLSVALLKIFGVPRRKYGEKNEKDKLCLNMWLDENDLVWDKKDRNAFTAHEISQIIPLVNKNEIYENFLSKNNWINNYWPNATGVKMGRKKDKISRRRLIESIFEPLARRMQYWYMKEKITREVVTPTRAIFHPVDWGNLISSKLKLY